MQSIIRFSFALARLAIFLLTTHVGRIIAGTIFIIVGIIFGLSSHMVVYQQAPQASYEVATLYNGAYYLRQSGSSTYYIINTEGFTPSLEHNPLNVGNNSYLSSLEYKSDSAANVNIVLDDGSQASGTGYTVVEFTIAGTDGQASQPFASTEYNQHPHGFYNNRWMIGSILLGIGIFFLLFTFLAPLIADSITSKREKKPNEFLGVIRK